MTFCAGGPIPKTCSPGTTPQSPDSSRRSDGSWCSPASRTGGTGRPMRSPFASPPSTMSAGLQARRRGRRPGRRTGTVGSTTLNDDRLHLNPQVMPVAAAVLETPTESTVTIPAGGASHPRRHHRFRRRTELTADLSWARNHFAPWVATRARVSSGTAEPRRTRSCEQPRLRGSMIAQESTVLTRGDSWRRCGGIRRRSRPSAPEQIPARSAPARV